MHPLIIILFTLFINDKWPPIRFNFVIICEPNFYFSCFQFSGKHFAGLKDLADAIDIDAGAEWELRLYSFDSRLSPKEMAAFKVVYAHVPNEQDELDLVRDVIVFMSPVSPVLILKQQ